MVTTMFGRPRVPGWLSSPRPNGRYACPTSTDVKEQVSVRAMTERCGHALHLGGVSALGVPRREYSLASKVLHWLMPWARPVYDSFVRRMLGVSVSWDHPQAYRKVATGVFALARTVTGDSGWIGFLEPRSPLRALDKLTWWLVAAASAVPEIRDPWQAPANSASNALDYLTSCAQAQLAHLPVCRKGQAIGPADPPRSVSVQSCPALRNRRSDRHVSRPALSRRPRRMVWSACVPAAHLGSRPGRCRRGMLGLAAWQVRRLGRVGGRAGPDGLARPPARLAVVYTRGGRLVATPGRRLHPVPAGTAA